MSDEDQLRSGLQTLVAGQPVPVDRVAGVRTRVRRRARQRLAVGGAALSVGALTAGLLVLPGDGDREALPARPAPSATASASDGVPRNDRGERTDVRVRITEVVVSLPDRTFAEQDAAVTGLLAGLPELPGRIGRPLEEPLIVDGRPRPKNLQLSFVRVLTPSQRADVTEVLRSVEGAVLQTGDADGLDLELVAPLSPGVLASLPTPQHVPDTTGSDLRVLGAYSLSREGDELVVAYVGNELSDEVLDRARLALTGLTGALPDQVRLRRGAGEPGFSDTSGD